MTFLKYIFILYTAIFLICCVNLSGGLIKLSADTASIKFQMKQIFPSGSNVANAEKLLTDEGFTCSYMVDEDFAESSGKGEAIYHRNKSFLYCSLEKSTGCLSLVSERWQICIVHKEMITEDIFVSYGLTGP